MPILLFGKAATRAQVVGLIAQGPEVEQGQSVSLLIGCGRRLYMHGLLFVPHSLILWNLKQLLGWGGTLLLLTPGESPDPPLPSGKYS